MHGTLTAEEIENVLRTASVGRIGCLVEGWPYVVPVTYAYDGEFVYVHSADGMKVRAMRANPNVCFEVEQIETRTKWRTVIARGHFEDLWRDPDEFAMKLLSARSASTPPPAAPPVEPPRTKLPHDREERPIVYRIRVLERTGRFENG
jgi:nitroimidazol reductase NimA-like FMN-containing flavoprotein (pyridoxamine 5'-phosphate oxidase superfamily)